MRSRDRIDGRLDVVLELGRRQPVLKPERDRAEGDPMNGDRAFLYGIPCVAAGLALGYYGSLFFKWSFGQ